MRLQKKIHFPFFGYNLKWPHQKKRCMKFVLWFIGGKLTVYKLDYSQNLIIFSTEFVQHYFFVIFFFQSITRTKNFMLHTNFYGFFLSCIMSTWKNLLKVFFSLSSHYNIHDYITPKGYQVHNNWECKKHEKQKQNDVHFLCVVWIVEVIKVSLLEDVVGRSI